MLFVWVYHINVLIVWGGKNSIKFNTFWTLGDTFVRRSLSRSSAGFKKTLKLTLFAIT